MPLAVFSLPSIDSAIEASLKFYYQPFQYIKTPFCASLLLSIFIRFSNIGCGLNKPRSQRLTVCGDTPILIANFSWVSLSFFLICIISSDVIVAPHFHHKLNTCLSTCQAKNEFLFAYAIKELRWFLFLGEGKYR
jgi:hypothetical protein